MRTKWMVPVVLAVAALAFAGGRWSAQPAAGFDPLRDLEAGRLVKWLGLSEAQAADLHALGPAYARTVNQACDQQCAARCELAASLGAAKFDPARSRLLIEKMCEAHKANELATVEHIARVHELLTPEQRGRFLGMIGQCLCTTCGSGGPSCCVATNQIETKEPAP